MGAIQPPHTYGSFSCLFTFFSFVVVNTSKSCREQLWSSWLNCFITQTTPFHPGTLAHNVTACDWITRACWIAQSPYMETTCLFFRSLLSVAPPVSGLCYHKGLAAACCDLALRWLWLYMSCKKANRCWFKLSQSWLNWVFKALQKHFLDCITWKKIVVTMVK